MVEGFEDNFSDSPEKLKLLLEDAEKHFYIGCHKYTKLFVLVQLLNLKSKHGASDKCFNELLPLIKSMLPKDNEMFKSTYEAKNTKVNGFMI